jgi:hypothetical protein
MPFTLHPRKARKPRRGRRGHPAIPAGTELWLITLPGGGYFHFAYIHHDTAKGVAARLKAENERGRFYADFNRKLDPETCVHAFT